MRTLPPDRPGAPPSAPGEHASGGPEEAGPDGPVVPGCPRSPAQSRPCTGPRPLPDPAAVRLCLIPDSAPPYDAEVEAASAPGTAGAPGPASRTGPGGAEVPREAGRRDSPELGQPPARPGSRGGPSSPVPSHAGPGSPLPSRGGPGSPLPSHRRPGSPLPSPGWPGRFAQVLAETLAGSRPARQLVPWTTERARERIQRLGPQLSAGQQPQVRRVMTFHPTADVLEMTVVVAFGMRVHALAVRMERTGGGQAAADRPGPAGWLCTTIEAA
jgi:hypothetical protein